MKTEQLIKANSMRLVFVCQNPFGWGKGVTLKASKNALKVHTKKQPTSVHIYLIKDGFSYQEAADSINVSDMSITFNSDQCILLQCTEF